MGHTLCNRVEIRMEVPKLKGTREMCWGSKGRGLKSGGGFRYRSTSTYARYFVQDYQKTKWWVSLSLYPPYARYALLIQIT